MHLSPRRRAAWGAAALRGAAVASLAGLAACAGLRGAGPPPAVRVDCATAAVVGLAWPAVRGAAGYRVSRDGRVLGDTAATGFADTGVAGASSYHYAVSALAGRGPAAAAGAAGVLEVTTDPAQPDGDAPYCASHAIRGLAWDWAHALRAAEGSDLWPVTWGRDGAVYAFFGDGGGFGGDDHRGRTSFGIARITGAPPPTAADEVNLYGGYAAVHPATVDGKARALIAVGADFYAVGGVFRADDPRSTLPKPVSGSPDHVELLVSKGNAFSWRDSGWSFCAAASDAAFCPVGFVQFGRGNAGAPDREVYVLGTSLAADARTEAASASGAAGAGTYLARAPARHLLRAAAYEYFGGLDARGRPRWTRDPAGMQAVFTDHNAPQPGCGGRCAMAATLEDAVYDAGLRRFVGVAQGDLLAQTSFYEACHPWGPWHTLDYHNIHAADGRGGWGRLGAGAGESLGVHPVGAWSSADGRTLWMTYSSDGVAPPEAAFPPAGAKLDAFQLVSVALDAPASGEPCDGLAAQ